MPSNDMHTNELRPSASQCSLKDSNLQPSPSYRRDDGRVIGCSPTHAHGNSSDDTRTAPERGHRDRNASVTASGHSLGTEATRPIRNRRPLSTTNPNKNAKGARGNGLAHVSAADSAYLCTESHPKSVPETSLDLNGWPALSDALRARSCVYALVDPREPERWRYVGKAHAPVMRLLAHLHGDRNCRCWRWIARLRKDGLYPVMVVLEEAPPRRLSKRESWWIDEARRRGHELYNRKRYTGYRLSQTARRKQALGAA